MEFHSRMKHILGFCWGYSYCVDTVNYNVVWKETRKQYYWTKKVVFGKGTRLFVRPSTIFHQVRCLTFCPGVKHCVNDGTRKVTFGGGTRLLVTPNLDDSPPSIYKLEPYSETEEDVAVCLFTDYSPPEIMTVRTTSQTNVPINSSVVTVDNKSSYGAVLWGNNRETSGCYASYKSIDYWPTDTKEASNTCSEDTAPGFETDEKLNLLSFTVLGLRLIFLKTVAVNLLLTFQMWSR